MINFGAAPLNVLGLIKITLQFTIMAHCHYLSQIIDINRFNSLIIGKERGALYFTIHLSMFLVSEEKFTPIV